MTDPCTTSSMMNNYSGQTDFLWPIFDTGVAASVGIFDDYTSKNVV